MVLKADVSEFSRLVAAMAIKDQQPPLALAMPSVFVEMLNPFEAELVVGPSVLAYSDSPGWWKAGLVPCHLVKLAVKDDEWWDSPSFSVDCLDCCDPFPVARLTCPWSPLPI